MPSSYPTQDGRIKYDQFFIFGDSITQFSYDQRLGFGFGAALESGESLCWLYSDIVQNSQEVADTFGLLDYARRLDVVNRGFR